MFRLQQKVKIKRHAQRALPEELRRQTGCVIEVGQALTYMYKVQFEDGTVRWLPFNAIEECRPYGNVLFKLCAILLGTKGLHLIARTRQVNGNNRAGVKTARRQTDRSRGDAVK
jgi:hypothetical protein